MNKRKKKTVACHSEIQQNSRKVALSCSPPYTSISTTRQSLIINLLEKNTKELKCVLGSVCRKNLRIKLELKKKEILTQFQAWGEARRNNPAGWWWWCLRLRWLCPRKPIDRRSRLKPMPTVLLYAAIEAPSL